MNRLSVSFLALILIFLASCAKPQIKGPSVFYPGPPDPPRLQYLTSFDKAGDIERKSAFFSFVTRGKGKSLVLDKPYGIAAYEGKIYVCDTNQTVVVIDLNKSTFAPLPGALQGPGKIMQPINISIDKDGNKYIADPVRGQIVMFDRNDSYKKAFGPLEEWKPADAVALDGLLYVADIKNALIQVFDIESGAFRNSFGKGEFSMPSNLAFDSSGYLYVSDVGRFQIVKVDRDGHALDTIGSLGRQTGSFARPKGIAFDRQDRLYVVDAAFNNLQVFDTKDNAMLLFFSKGGLEPGDLYLAAKVAIDYDDVKYFQHYADPNFQIEYLIFVTSQFGHKKVNVYGFGSTKGEAYKSDEQLLKELKEKQQKDELEHPEKTQDKKIEDQNSGDAVPKKR